MDGLNQDFVGSEYDIPSMKDVVVCDACQMLDCPHTCISSSSLSYQSPYLSKDLVCSFNLIAIVMLYKVSKHRLLVLSQVASDVCQLDENGNPKVSFFVCARSPQPIHSVNYC